MASWQWKQNPGVADSWIPRIYYGKTLTPRGNRHIGYVSELIDQNGLWKEQLVRETFYPIHAEAILNIKPSRSGNDDVLAWQPELNGIFSVRSTYKLALVDQPEQCAVGTSSTHPDGQDECLLKIWRSTVPPKVKFFAWKAAS